MTQAWYYAEPDLGRWRRVRVTSGPELDDVVAEVLARKSDIGHPTLTVKRDDGTSLTFSTDGERAYLVHFAADGTSQSSVGPTADGPTLVYDYEGHWSEAASASTVPVAAAVEVLRAFVAVGRIEQAGVAFEAD